MSVLRAWWWLSVALLKRSARDGMVVRSLATPPIIVFGAFGLTLLLSATRAVHPAVALSPELAADTEFVAQIEGVEWSWFVSKELERAVRESDATFATDGHTLWSAGTDEGELKLEGFLRARQAEPTWTLVMPPPDRVSRTRGLEQALPPGIALLYALYATVFGVGMLTRDREDGTLDAEHTLAIPTWVHGAARWTAGAIGVLAWVVLSLFVFSTLFTLRAPLAAVLHESAAVLTGLAVGLAAASPARATFSSALAVALTAASGLFILGAAVPALGPWVPLLSLGQQSGGVTAFLGALLLSVGAVALTGRASA